MYSVINRVVKEKTKKPLDVKLSRMTLAKYKENYSFFLSFCLSFYL